MSFNIIASLNGMDEFIDKVDNVKEKAIALEQAVKQLNEVEFTFSISHQD